MEKWKVIAADIIKAIKVVKEENHRLETENEELKETFSKIMNILKAANTDYQLIDLGLPSGTLWMDRNVGASSPEDAGLYFVWGETKGYTADEVGRAKDFTWSDYKYNNGESNKLTKYCKNYHYSNDGYTDYLTALETIDNAACQYTSGKCKTPTKEQLQELINETISTWITQNGVNGRLFTSKTNGNSIFVPAVGYGNNGSMNNIGSNGVLWSSSLYGGSTNYAWSLNFGSDDCYLYFNYRYYGLSVRGVADSSKENSQ